MSKKPEERFDRNGLLNYHTAIMLLLRANRKEKKMNLITNEEYKQKCKTLGHSLIGGADAAAVIGVHPYKSAFCVWKEKIQGRNEFLSNKAIEIGLEIEEFLIRMFCREMQFNYVPKGTQELRGYSEELPHLISSYDYWGVNTDNEKYILETKFSDSRNESEWENNNIPHQYYWQCIQYLATSDASVVYLFGLVGREKYLKIFKRDEVQSDIDKLISVTKDFYDTFIVTNTPPPVDGSDSTKETLSQMKWEGVPQLSEDVDKLLKRDKELSEIIKSVEKDRAEIRNKIEFYLHGEPKAQTKSFNITMVTFTKKSFDQKTFKEENEELFARYMKDSVVRYPKFTERKKED